MRKRIIIFCQYVIWICEGHAREYYRKQLDVFWNFIVPQQVYEIRKKFGLVNMMRGYAGCTGNYKFIDGVLAKTTGEIGNVVGWDDEKMILEAVEQKREERVKRNLNRLDQVVEKYVQDNKGRKLADLKGV